MWRRGVSSSGALCAATALVGCGAASTGEPSPNDDTRTDEGTSLTSTSSAPSSWADGALVSSSSTIEQSSTASTGVGTAASAPLTDAPVGDFSFIPWEELSDTNQGQGLVGPVVLRSVSAWSGYGEEDILLTVAVAGQDNRVLAIDTTARTFREHWLHFACGDCKASASGGRSVVITPTSAYASTDGGYRYWDLATDNYLGTDPAFEVRVVSEQVWVWSSSVWSNAPLQPNTSFALAPWQRGIFSVWRDTGLQSSNVFIRLRHVSEPDGPTEPESENPCVDAPEYYEFGLTSHDDERTVVACRDSTVAVSSGYPAHPFELWQLDGPPLWVSTQYVATAKSWYSLERRGAVVAAQGPLAADEEIGGYVATATQGLRVSNFGIAVSLLQH
jgi:hypothetical protein